MKSRIIVLVALTSVLLLAGCKSEAEKKLDEACSLDMSIGKNKEACRLALAINCGGLASAALDRCADKGSHEEAVVCAAFPSYCFDGYSKAFGSEKK